MRQILIILFLIISSLFLESCTRNSASVDSTQKIKTDSIKTRFDIKSFLFLKKGMTLEEVLQYLNQNSIRHTSPQFIKSDETKIMDIFEYKIEDLVIDTFRLSFIGDKLKMFNYYKYFNYFSETDINNENRGYNKYNKVIEKTSPILEAFLKGLTEKYGEPNSSLSERYSLVTDFDCKNDNSFNCNSFFVYWNKPEDESVINSENVSIILKNNFCCQNTMFVTGGASTSYFINYQIQVDFTDDEIRSIIDKRWEKIKRDQKKIREKRDSLLKDKKIRFQNQL